jgi:hypothetical protein
MNAVNTQSAKAHRSALLCFALALLTMATTAWFVVEGINATEPDSPARWAKVASGVLLLVLEASAFGLAGQWPEHSKVLRALGWAVLALEITLMSVSQISIGMTAAKSASNGAGTIEEIRAQAKEARASADALRADAANMRKSKHGWIQQQAGERSAAAAEQSKSAAAAVASLEKHGAAVVSTPIVEIVGKGGLIGLSIALSVALSLSGIVLMHVAGSLWRRASGALPVDVQILELLQRIHGAPAAPAQAAEIVAPAPALAAPVAPVPAPAPASFKTAEPIEPKNYSTGLAYSSKIKLAGAGLLGAAGALTAPITHAAPAVPTQAKTPSVPAVAPANGVSKPIHAGVSETIHADHANEGGADASNAAPAVLETSPDGVSKPIHADVPKPIQQIVKKPRAKRAASAKLDTGVEGHAGARFKRIRAGVVSGKIRPSVRGIQAVEGGSQEVVADYLRQLETEGVIVRAGRGFALVKKDGSK